MAAHITVYGCQMNKLDAELTAEVLREAGHEVVDDPDRARILLYLTCSVRAHAENRVFSNLGALARRKERDPDLVVGLLGCMAQAHGEGAFERAPVLDLVCAPGRLAELPDLLAAARAGRRAVALDPARPAVFDGSDAALDRIEAGRPVPEATPGHAFVRAMRGCDNFCAYCIVPHVRGPERSRPPSAVLEEVRRLTRAGIRHVTLVGQAVNQYRAKEGGGTWRLADLLAAVSAEVPDLVRLSFITNHPRSMTPDLAACFRDVPRVQPYLHMPAQAGSDAVLRRMNRGYTARGYLDRVAMAREARPGLGVASDFIVGFPGETETDFEETMDLARRVRFASAFVFSYSPRPGTRAADWPDDVPREEKKRRHQALLDGVTEIAAEENAALVGCTERVFVEGPSPRPHLDATPDEAPSGKDAPQLRGRTGCNRIVVFEGPADLAGHEVAVEIERAAGLTLFGRRL